MPPCSGQSRPSPAGSREDAASLDRPCARRLRELAVGMEEYSRRGSNQRMRPKRAGKPTISNRWFSSNFRLALTATRSATSATRTGPRGGARRGSVRQHLHRGGREPRLSAVSAPDVGANRNPDSKTDRPIAGLRGGGGHGWIVGGELRALAEPDAPFVRPRPSALLLGRLGRRQTRSRLLQPPCGAD